jgi:hypothetical protein
LKARFGLEENTVVGVCGVNGVGFLFAGLRMGKAKREGRGKERANGEGVG